jgi:hypothetical protein
MNDLETRLKDSLQTAGQSFRPSSARMPERFTKARRRRLVLRSVSAVAVVALLAVLAVVVLPTDEAIDDPPPVGPVPAPAPEGPIEISARVAVDPHPLGVAIGERHVFVGHADGDSVEQVEPRFNEVMGHFGTSRDLPPPERVAAGPDALFVARSGSLTRWDLVSGERPIEAESGISRTVTDLVYADGLVWVAASDPDETAGHYKVFVFSARDLRPLMLFPDGVDKVIPNPPHIDYGYGALWIATNGDDEDGLLRVDSKTGRVDSIEGVTSASDVAVGAGGVWVYENSSNKMRSRLLYVNPETFEVEEKATVLGYFAWLEADENGVWVLNASDETDRRLLRIDPITGDSMGTALKLGAGPFEMTSGFGSIWITDEGNGELLRVDVGESNDIDEPSPTPSQSPSNESTADGMTTYTEETLGFSIAYPASWDGEIGLTELVSPSELLTVGSFPLPVGGSCAPIQAVQAMGREDVLLQVLEYSKGNSKDFPPLRGPLSPQDASSPSVRECWGVPVQDVRFRTNGRRLQVHIVQGSEVSDVREEELWDAINSIEAVSPTSGKRVGGDSSKGSRARAALKAARRALKRAEAQLSRSSR